MVWPFSSSSQDTSTNPNSSGPKSRDGGFIAPDRSAREKCYESRDRLFDCLDRNDILDAVKEDEKTRRVCKGENEVYERDCAKAWIKYFKEKRVMEYNRDRTIERIKADDARMVAKQKAEKKGRGLFG
ncbi:hypothetical protein GJ744_007725 [Endocarpon pusillum]|uniref:Cytochrome c oxidase assembly factor 6 n=1 Tax=Endocarpon pusillum TaxID=364733 RepID=A0A8H7ASQ4_9EURO|nr:hypothetical protein GJ744_007725 [Endocarpon pusillum]